MPRGRVSDATLEKQLMALANFRLKASKLQYVYYLYYRIFTAIKPLWQTLRCSASAFHSVLHSTLARHHSCDSQPVQLAASPPSTCRSYCEVRRGLLRVQVASRNAEFSGSLASSCSICCRCSGVSRRCGVAVLVFFSVILCFWRWLFTLLGGG